MRQVQVYIEGLKIELFEDEQINVTSSVQNINDISKVFTDQVLIILIIMIN